MSKISDRLVSRKFRELIIKEYPKIVSNPAFLSLFGYLAFPSCFDDEGSGKPLLPAEILAEIEGKEHLIQGNNYNAKPFLDKFMNNVQAFKLSAWDSREKRARIIEEVSFPPLISEAIDAESNKLWSHGGLVFLNSGVSFDAKLRVRSRASDKQEALVLMQKAQVKEAKAILEYLNTLPVNHFTKLLTNLPKALEVALKLPKSSKRQADLLRIIYGQLQPFYKPTDGSVRLYQVNESIPLLQKDVRKALTKGWVEADLTSSQLAICAKDWNVPAVIEFLKSGKSIWKYLSEQMNITFSPDFKKKIKPALYRVCFGSTKRGLRKEFSDAGLDKCFERFLKIPLVAAMWKARERQKRIIGKNKGAFNCFGQWLGRDKFTARSILAQKAQALEMKLVYPMFELANELKSQFVITLYQFDGISIKFNDKRRIVKLKWLISFKVEEKANELGIPTGIEFQ